MKKAFACVKRDDASYCGRPLAGLFEFTFLDPACAVHYYAGSKWLDVCSLCVTAIGEIAKPVSHGR